MRSLTYVVLILGALGGLVASLLVIVDSVGVVRGLNAVDVDTKDDRCRHKARVSLSSRLGLLWSEKTYSQECRRRARPCARDQQTLEHRKDHVSKQPCGRGGLGGNVLAACSRMCARSETNSSAEVEAYRLATGARRAGAAARAREGNRRADMVDKGTVVSQ